MEINKRIESEREQAAEILKAGIVLWLIFCAFSIMAIEHANTLMWIFLISAWAYPLNIFISLRLSGSFYQNEKYKTARLILWSPIWFPLLIGWLSDVLKW